ncbi:MAG: hypothetical protein R6V86_04450 [Spirochaetia bacterium]
MSDSFFLDTNLLVYSFDSKAHEKQERAQQLIRLALEGQGAISRQVIQEFSNVALHKFEKPMGRDDLWHDSLILVSALLVTVLLYQYCTK